MRKISVVVVEYHQMIREMWVQLFNEKKDIKIVGETGDFDEAIEMIRTRQPDLVLLDISLAVASGMEAVQLITKYAPATKVIAVSMHNHPAYAKKMMQAGVKGYVTKNSSQKEFLIAVDEVIAGKKFVCSEIKNMLADQTFQPESAGPGTKELSNREAEILKLIKQGLSSKEIGKHLKLNVVTVNVHRHHILKKLGLKHFAALINFIHKEDNPY